MLNGKQKRYLRFLANRENAIFQIGKNGLDKNTLISIDQALIARELVKIHVLKSCDIPLNELILDTLAFTKAELVQTIGKTYVLYKKAKEPKIILP